MSRRHISCFSLRVILTGLLLCLIPILAAHAEPDAPTAAAATGSISGRVIDVLTGLPIADVTVEAVNVSIETKTDADGRYRLANVPAGERYVLFDSDRYAYEYYVDAPRMFLAQTVKVVAGEETTGIDAALAPAGRITGRVTDQETGVALAGVRVRAGLPQYRPSWIPRIVREAVTDADGRYALEGLWTAVYSVEFVDEAGDHATQRYGTDVGVLTGEDPSADGAGGIDVALQHEGHIAGQVTDLTGAPLAGVTVAVLALDTGGDLAATVETDAGGQYEATSLPAGKYWLHFEPHDRLHAARYYGGEAEDAEKSQSIYVEVGRTTDGVDQQLPELAAITGRVTDTATGAGLRGIGVYLDWYSEYREPDVTTAPDGTYIIPSVAAGNQTVWLHDASGKYRDGQARQQDDSEIVMVAEGRVSREVNAALTSWTAIPITRKITGTVTDLVTGQPLAGIAARLWWCYRDGHRWECDDLGGGTTDAQGRYEMDNPDGRAAGLTFSNPSGAYLSQDAPNFRSPGADEVVVIDMALQRYDRVYGGISGKVTAATGKPLAGQRVCADNVTGANQGCAFTGEDGTYRIDGLKTGQYKVGFGLWNRLGDRYPRWYYGGDDAGTDVTVAVKPNEITPNIDAALPENGRITGTVYSSLTGGPLANAGLAMCVDHQTCNSVGTGADGSYVVYEAPGAYRLFASANGYESRYYRDVLKWEQATPVTVTLGVATAGIDITLPHLGRIAGQVTDAGTGAALVGITVKINGGGYTVKTGPEGWYEGPDLPSGAYRVRFEDPKGIYATGETAQPVTVTVNTTATVDAALVPNGYITGRVTAAESGEPLGGIEIRAGSLMLWTASDGTYQIGPLPDGEYQVRYWDPALLRRMDYSPKVTVEAGQADPVVDHAMILLGVARGRVIDADTGAPIAGVKVWGPGEWPKYNRVYTDAEGRYELNGLNDGTYGITGNDQSHLYIDGQSAAVTMAAGTVIDAPDVKLKRWGEFGGTVTDALTGQPAPGTWVVLYQPTSWGEWYLRGCAITGPDGTYRIRELYDEAVWPVFSDPQARFHSQSYGGGKSLLDAQTVTFKRGADLLGIDGALVRKGDGPPVEPRQRVWLPVVMGE